MDSTSRSLRLALLAVAIANVAFATLFLFQPDVVSNLYEGAQLDNMHAYLGSGYGALLVVIAIGALLAFAHPVRYAGIVLLIIIAQFLLFTTDVVHLAREDMRVFTLLPEMVYFLLTAVLLIRYYPVEEKKKEEEQPKKDEDKAAEQPSATTEDTEKAHTPLFDDTDDTTPSS